MADSIALDVTPTWAGLMPGLILALTHGTGEGRRIAAEELEKLARAVDSANARARAEAPKAAARSEALETARSCLAAYPAIAKGKGRESAPARRARDLRDTLAGLVASMEEGAGQ